jgi:hypothetical protein
VEKRRLGTCTIAFMQHNMVVRAARPERAKCLRLVIFPADQNTPGVWLQLDAVRQVSQSQSNLTHELYLCRPRFRMCFEHGGNRSNQELFYYMTTEERGDRVSEAAWRLGPKNDWWYVEA